MNQSLVSNSVLRRFGIRGTVACLLLWGSAAGAAENERVETAVFRSGTEGYKIYRIPAVIRSRAGTVLAFCEGRKNSGADNGDIDLVLKRSTDGGATWGPLIVAQEEGGNAPITIGNPSPVVDQSTGTIWLVFCRNNREVFVTSSADDGRTWSPRVSLTAKVSKKEWFWYATGPGHGIQLSRGTHAGRLVIPCDHQVGKTWGSHVIYSDDHGKTWKLGGLLSQKEKLMPNESVAVELTDGRLYLNCRNQGPGRRRVFGISRDGGASFEGPFADETLIEPTVQGSAIRARARDAGDAEDLILFSNPATTKDRTHLTIRQSRDETASWDAGTLWCEGPAAYSDLVQISKNRFGVLYETGKANAYETITFGRFDLSFLNKPADATGAR